jgi:hypothetical protein
VADVAETDIINPTTEFWPTLNDSPNPSYGFERRTTPNNAVAKARLGPPYSRDTLNNGYAFALTYLGRPWSTILRLKHFYDSFKDGYFTYIDYDGGGRHHVGRFTSPINAIEKSNGSYDVQMAIFEEVPQARMLEYPADFANWSKRINVLDDYLDVKVATTSATPGAWVPQLDPTVAGASATTVSAYEMFNRAPALYDWAQIQYVGWGFRMMFRQGAGLGQIAIQVDGIFAGVLDLSNGALVGALGFVPGLTIAAGVVTCTQMPLDMHRVKVQAYAAGSVGALLNATGSIAITASRPGGAHDNGCSWSTFNLLSTPLPADAVIQGIYPVMLASGSDPDGLIEYLAYGSGITVGSGGGSGFANGPLAPPTAPRNPGTTFSAGTFYDASIGTSLSAITGQAMVAKYSDSLFTDGLDDSITVAGVGFAIYYESATASIDTQMPAPFAVPSGQGLTWALPTATANTGTTASIVPLGVSASTAATFGPGGTSAIFPAVTVIV